MCVCACLKLTDMNSEAASSVTRRNNKTQLKTYALLAHRLRNIRAFEKSQSEAFVCKILLNISALAAPIINR